MQVTPTFVIPPAVNTSFCVPAPAKAYLAVINAPPADQDVPLYSSVQETPGTALIKPPATSAAFCVPAPVKACLAIIKAPPTDQDVPLYSSVQETVAFV